MLDDALSMRLQLEIFKTHISKTFRVLSPTGTVHTQSMADQMDLFPPVPLLAGLQPFQVSEMHCLRPLVHISPPRSFLLQSWDSALIVDCPPA